MVLVGVVAVVVELAVVVDDEEPSETTETVPA
jgi:hypothetical protein